MVGVFHSEPKYFWVMFVLLLQEQVSDWRKKKKKKHLGFCDVGFLPVTATGTIKAQNSDEMMQNCRLTESVYPCSFNCQIQADSPACVSQNQLNLKFG